MESIEPNNFEDQVKNKMDELKIRPSESAWLNIEKRISNKGKQRKVVFILFFLALFILTGGYWLFNSGKDFKTIANNQTQEVIKEDSQKARAEKKDSSLTQSIFSDKNPIAKVESKAPENRFAFEGKIEKYKKHKGWKDLKSAPVVFVKKNRIISEEESNKMTSDEVSITNEKSRNSNDDQNKALAKNDAEIKSEQKKYSIEKNGLDTVKENRKTDKVINKPDSDLANNKEKNSKETSSVIKNQKNKWQVGLTFSGGISSIGNDPFGLNKNSQSFSSPMYSGPGTGTISYSTPTRMRNSIAFICGVFIEKNISRKSSVSFGINYKYFSALNKTSDSVSSGQTIYYAGPVSRNYHNSFNFLELPVSLKLALNKSKSVPLYWHVGMSVSQLISSNALQFKPGAGKYYIDNSLFNKTQIGFSTGLSMTLMSKQKYPVSIGPEIYYGVSGIANDGLYKKKHFSYLGISAEILF